MTRLVLAASVGVAVLDDVVYVAPLPHGPIIVLAGISAFIWESSLEHDRDDIAVHVAAATQLSVSVVAGPIDAFVDELVRRGVLLLRDQ